MRRLAPTFFLRGCSHTRLLPRTSACLWTASRERKLRRREGARRDPDGSGILTRYNRPTAGRVAHLAGRKCNHRDQRRADCKRGWRLALHGVAVGGAAARIGRESKEPSRRRILPGASPRYPDSRHAEATAEGQSFRETHISFFQDGFDESSSAGIGTCRRTGGRGRPSGRANRGTRPGGTLVAFPTRGGHLRDFASSAKTGAGTGSAADHDGGTLREFESDYNRFLREGVASVVARFESVSSYAKGKRVRVTNGTESYVGTTAGLGPEGLLQVEREDGRVTAVISGDVTEAR